MEMRCEGVCGCLTLVKALIRFKSLVGSKALIGRKALILFGLILRRKALIVVKILIVHNHTPFELLKIFYHKLRHKSIDWTKK